MARQEFPPKLVHGCVLLGYRWPTALVLQKLIVGKLPAPLGDLVKFDISGFDMPA